MSCLNSAKLLLSFFELFKISKVDKINNFYLSSLKSAKRLVTFFDLFNVSKMTTNIFDLFKVGKITANIFDLFKAVKRLDLKPTEQSLKDYCE